jgi:threonine/homoserine/homoserine lactone efflux protein
MSGELYLRGVVIGFAIAFALGPIGLLVIRRTIDRGWAFGFISGVGVAAADSTYGAIAAFGLTAITEVLVGIDRPLGIVGGAVLVYLAFRSLRDALQGGSGSDSSADAAEARAAGAAAGPGSPGGKVGGFASMYGLTLTNPATILSFGALFASIGAGTGGAGGASAVVLGVFTGSITWWALLTGLVAGLRARLTPRVVRALNIASALLIGAFGVIAIALGVIG